MVLCGRKRGCFCLPPAKARRRGSVYALFQLIDQQVSGVGDAADDDFSGVVTRGIFRGQLHYCAWTLPSRSKDNFEQHLPPSRPLGKVAPLALAVVRHGRAGAGIAAAINAAFDFGSHDLIAISGVSCATRPA